MSRIERFGAERTNQKLYFARLALKTEADNEQMEQMHLEEAVFHLASAVSGLEAEIKAFYRIPLSETLTQAQQTMNQRGQCSPEIERLNELRATDFIGQIELVLNSCFHTPLRKDKSDQPSLILQSSDHWIPSKPIIEEWRVQLKELINWIRSSMRQQ